MQDDTSSVDATDPASRWTLIRDISVLQVKLVIDGLRDLVLVPISLLAGVLSLVTSRDEPSNAFYDLLRLGKRSERWINLFGAVEKAPAMDKEFVRFPNEDIDAVVGRVESFVVEQYRKGGVTRQAKEKLDKALDSLHKLASGQAKQSKEKTSED